jgi:hypothetical protein
VLSGLRSCAHSRRMPAACRSASQRLALSCHHASRRCCSSTSSPRCRSADRRVLGLHQRHGGRGVTIMVTTHFWTRRSATSRALIYRGKCIAIDTLSAAGMVKSEATPHRRWDAYRSRRCVQRGGGEPDRRGEQRWQHPRPGAKRDIAGHATTSFVVAFVLPAAAPAGSDSASPLMQPG